VLFAQASRADQPRWRTSFSSPNGQYTLRVILVRADTVQSLGSGQRARVQLTTWGLLDNTTGKQLYQLDTQDAIQTKTALLANNGETIVVVDDWSAGVPVPFWPVLSFYHWGHETHTYTLGELLGPTYPLSESVSHFSWFERYHFSPATATFTLQTFAQQELVFEGHSGQRLATKYQALVTPGSQLAYGRIEKLSAHRYALTVCRPYYGPVQANERVRFRSQYTLRTGDFVLALLQEGQSKHLVQRINAWYGEPLTCGQPTAGPK
jgi:hypothetical protein